MRRESSWANHEMRDCWSSRPWSIANLAILCRLDPLLHLLLLLHFLTLVHPFLSLVLHSRERERGEWKGSEWSWGSTLGNYLYFMLTCGPCPIVDNSSLSTYPTVSAFLSDGSVTLADYPVNLFLCTIELRIRVPSFGLISRFTHVLPSFRGDKESLLMFSWDISWRWSPIWLLVD